jgi:formylglycine-generating enzyme required for sulfatase activity
MRRVHVILAALFALAAAPLAIAQSPAQPQPPATAPASTAPHPNATATGAPLRPPGEGEEGEPEHPAQPTREKPEPGKPAFVRGPVVLKDGMVRIPGGRFTMGTIEKAAQPNERPTRNVSTPPFWIDKTEVSVGAYRACVDRGACPRPVRSSAFCTYDGADPQLPVSCVPWSSAQAFCTAVGKRLPREVEWELAARGTFQARYPWGGASTSCGMAATLASEGSARACSGKHPFRVGTHAQNASPFGVLDMAGNVEEWTADWYAETVSEASPRSGSSHVLRGGGWLSTPSQARTTSRNWGSVLEAGPNVGFRCARDD